MNNCQKTKNTSRFYHASSESIPLWKKHCSILEQPFKNPPLPAELEGCSNYVSSQTYRPVYSAQNSHQLYHQMLKENKELSRKEPKSFCNPLP